MGIGSLMKKITGSKAQLQIVIQEDAVYISSSKHKNEAPVRHPFDLNWESGLKDALKTFNVAKHTATVVLSSKYYQSYQIDKPVVPKEEWQPTALTFLLKDLISEKPTDIVADAYFLPDGKRVQAYVLTLSILTALTEILSEAQVTLQRVLPEEEVWGLTQADQQHFMLFYSSGKNSYKVGAFFNKKSRLQRSMRGVVSPLVGVASSDLQLDNVALELHRSIDYLSSQIRDATIRHLFVCCDDDNNEQLAEALSERLSLKVSPLDSEKKRTSGHMLCHSVAEISDEGINLYPAHLRIKKKEITLGVVAAVWIAAIVAVAGYYIYLNFQTNKIEDKLSLINQNKAVLEYHKKKLLDQLSSHRTTKSKELEAIRLAAEIDEKKAALAAISQFDNALKKGYSETMLSFATLSQQDISISTIKIEENVLSIKGQAITPESVPKWIQRFRTELSLVDRKFERMNIGRNENDIVTFELITEIKQDGQLGAKGILNVKP